MVRAFGQGHPNLKRLRLSSSDAGEATLSDDGRGTYAEVDGIRKRVGRGFAAAVGLTRPFGLRIIEFQYVSSQARRSRVAWGAADGVGADTAVRRSVGRHGTAFPTQNACAQTSVWCISLLWTARDSAGHVACPVVGQN